ncbi:hypothetical protein HELRODRAFT_191050 [Helobdella robusta]|uniref:Uncharacterized protein n=1 Tax=Helobdella robusta TaxID=6412 RepID=T1FSJ5_HELRO|nr:hypothetical protein HELRODRAFT_191050 [Helobdella robusta]ESO07814.1 hypothetical protein HELRODRAFT_191050 [Helobdella robusta]
MEQSLLGSCDQQSRDVLSTLSFSENKLINRPDYESDELDNNEIIDQMQLMHDDKSINHQNTSLLDDGNQYKRVNNHGGRISDCNEDALMSDITIELMMSSTSTDNLKSCSANLNFQVCNSTSKNGTRFFSDNEALEKTSSLCENVLLHDAKHSSQFDDVNLESNDAKQDRDSTSDDDLLNELERVVLGNLAEPASTLHSSNIYNSGNNIDMSVSESSSDISINLSAQSTAVKDLETLTKKYNALMMRLNHTTEERKSLEIVNINLERKIDVMVKNHEMEQKELQDRLIEQDRSFEELKEKLMRQLTLCKKDNFDSSQDHLLQLDLMNKKLDEARREKDEVVVRFAQAEQKNMELLERAQKAENKVKEWAKERETALARWKVMKEENKRAFDICDVQKAEILQLKKENEKLKEAESSCDVKIKWHMNKLKTEQDSHKETVTKLSDSTNLVNELKNEATILSETVRNMFNVLKELFPQQTIAQLASLPKIDVTNLCQAFQSIKKDLMTLLWKQKEIIHCLELEHKTQQEEVTSLHQQLTVQRENNTDLQHKISELQNMGDDYARLKSELSTATVRLSELESSHADLTNELALSKLREDENLKFNSKLSQINSELQASRDKMEVELEFATKNLTLLEEKCSSLDEQVKELMIAKERLNSDHVTQIEELKVKLEESQAKVEALNLKLKEIEDDMKISTRKHNAIIKDLRRQLQSRRPINGAEEFSQNGKLGDRDNNSLCSWRSHGGSSLSLDAITANQTVSSPPIVQSNHSKHGTSNEQQQLQQPANFNNVENSVDERIQQLQQHLRRKAGRIEFLKEHVAQLTEELHRKSKIIREYAIRVDAASLVPESSDRNKALLASKGGTTMASIFGSNHTDGSMSMALSIEINRKLQALVEDTLLKNIKLKECMDTLGQEIDWLTKDNKSLRAQLSNLEKNLADDNNRDLATNGNSTNNCVQDDDIVKDEVLSTCRKLIVTFFVHKFQRHYIFSLHLEKKSVTIKL